MEHFEPRSEKTTIFVDGIGGLAVITASQTIKYECKELTVFDVFTDLEKLGFGVYSVDVSVWTEPDCTGDGYHVVTQIEDHEIDAEMTAKLTIN